MSWTNTGGGDHEGADWTPADATPIAGVHYNIGTFFVTTGYTLPIDSATELEVYANTATITGTINGNANGRAGGVGGEPGTAGTGPGGGGAGINFDRGGGGGGYGGAGGAGGDNGGAGGAAHGSNTTIAITMGGGGGGGDSNGGGIGGNGGGSVTISANTITVDGIIQCDGEVGGTPIGDNGGSGGGGGGGVLLIGCTIVVSGTLTATGGAGGAGAGGGDGGGGGGGGRTKIFYRSLNTAGSTITVTAGAGGAGGGLAGAAGTAGTSYTDEIAQCTSALEFGQTFTPGTTGKVAIESVDLWVLSIATSGDFTLTIYDDTGKGTNYGSKSITVSGTGETTWTFDAWVELPDGTSQYYMELVADAGGEIDLGVYGNEPISGDDYYFNSELVERFAAYLKLNGIGHVDSPQIYNTADTSVKMSIANTMLIGAVHLIDTDGTGAVDYNDDFTTAKWATDSVYSSVTHDTGNDELDVADDGYIYWECDVKGVISGIPTLTSQINITVGAPTIQISLDAITWYDITAAIVDDVDTEYELDSASLSLKGKTLFYWRYDCVKASAATCSIKSFELDVKMHTIDFEHPKISESGVSAYRCDQGDSGIACEISLIYRDRSWVG